MEITLDIKKSVVYDEVQKITSYIGAKRINDNDVDAYDRMAATDSDVDLLERFWREACGSAIEELKPFVIDISTPENSQTIILSEIFSITLNLSDSFEKHLSEPLRKAVEEFLINTITAKWLLVSASEDAQNYQKFTIENGEEIRRMIYFRKRPEKP